MRESRFLRSTLLTVTLSLLLAGCAEPGPPLVITTTSLPNGTVGSAYNQTLAATGGIGALSWALAAGSGPLPPGLNLSAAGVVSGTPTQAGTFNFTVRVTDSGIDNGGSVIPPRTDTQALSITV